MTGTIVNAVGIVAGGFIGLLLKKGLPERLEKAIMKMLGLSILIIGLNGIITSMVKVLPGGGLSSSGELLLLFSLVVGAALGEHFDVEGKLDRMGRYIETRTRADGFSKGFISASIIFCIGAMAIIGSINDGLRGDSSVLFIKSALDCITSVILGSTLGFGVMFSAVPVLLYQGAMTLAAGWVAPLISDDLLAAFCMVGYAVVACIGINFLELTKIKTANLLPSLLVPVVYYAIRCLI